MCVFINFYCVSISSHITYGTADDVLEQMMTFSPALGGIEKLVTLLVPLLDENQIHVAPKQTAAAVAALVLHVYY